MKSSDIASIAESILLEDEKTLKKSGTKIYNDPTRGIIKADSPDVSKVKVNEEFTSKILEQSFGIKSNKPVIKINKPIKEESIPDKMDIDPELYIIRLMQLIKEAKDLISEMTSCGAIGVNMSNQTINNPKKDMKKFKSKFSKRLKRKLR